MHILPRITVLLCFTWISVWVLWGMTANGYPWYLNNMARSFAPENPKMALPFLVLAIPILLAGAVGALCWIRSKSSRQSQWRVPSLGVLSDERSLFVLFCLIPTSVFVTSSIRRHMDNLPFDRSLLDERTLANLTINIKANVIGFASIIAINFLFILVARHSPLNAVIGWSPPQALVFHRWLGTLVVIGSLLHGSMHTYRWIIVQQQNPWHIITISSDCWSFWTSGGERPCSNCGQCKAHIMNLTGFLAALPFLVIFLSSLEPVRRRVYRIFYAIHVIAAPMGIFFLLLHYPAALLYLSGGILYYAASSLPVFLERKCSGQQQVTLMSAEMVDCVASVEENTTVSDHRPCVSLTFQATPTAMERYRAGQYVRLWCPDIAYEAHPFTISPVLSSLSSSHNDEHDGNGTMRIIFRQTGRFTKLLGASLLNSEVPPKVFMEGFHGSSNRMDQLQRHDSVLIVAGGIGITPYLSLLAEIRDASHRSSSTASQNGTTRVIQLHWICRDRGLMEYIRSEYLDPIVETISGDYQIQCTIHYTGGTTTNQEMDSTQDEDADDEEDMLVVRRQEFTNPSRSEPFQPSKFAVGTKSTYRTNLPQFLSFAAIGTAGLTLIWVGIAHLGIAYTLIPIPLLILCLLVAVLVNKCLPEEHQGAQFLAVVDEDTTILSDSSLHASPGTWEFATLTTKRTNYNESASTAQEERSSWVRVQEGGRPMVPQLVASFLESTTTATGQSSCPGFFCCGPKSLMHSVRGAVRYGGSVWPEGGCDCGNLAVYEEAFEL